METQQDTRKVFIDLEWIQLLGEISASTIHYLDPHQSNH